MKPVLKKVFSTILAFSMLIPGIGTMNVMGVSPDEGMTEIQTLFTDEFNYETGEFTYSSCNNVWTGLNGKDTNPDMVTIKEENGNKYASVSKNTESGWSQGMKHNIQDQVTSGKISLSADIMMTAENSGQIELSNHWNIERPLLRFDGGAFMAHSSTDTCTKLTKTLIKGKTNEWYNVNLTVDYTNSVYEVRISQNDKLLYAESGLPIIDDNPGFAYLRFRNYKDGEFCVDNVKVKNVSTAGKENVKSGVYDTLDGYTSFLDGGIPTGSLTSTGWKAGPWGLGNTSIVTEADGNKVFQIPYDVNKSASIQYKIADTAVTSGILRFKFSLKPYGTTGPFIEVHSSDTIRTGGPVVLHLQGETLYTRGSSYDTSGAKVALGKIKNNEWIDVELVYNLDKNTYSIWLSKDGEVFRSVMDLTIFQNNSTTPHTDGIQVIRFRDWHYKSQIDNFEFEYLTEETRTPEDHLVGLWDFEGDEPLKDKAISGVVSDNLTNGGANGSGTWTYNKVNFENGVAKFPKGEKGALTASSSADLTPSGEMTVVLQMRHEVLQNMVFFDKRNYTDNIRAYGMYFNDSSLTEDEAGKTNLFVQVGKTDTLGGMAPNAHAVVSENEWCTVGFVVSYDDKGYLQTQIYYGNKCSDLHPGATEISTQTVIENDDTSLVIGNNKDMKAMAGLAEYSEVRLYSKALTTEELQSLDIEPPTSEQQLKTLLSTVPTDADSYREATWTNLMTAKANAESAIESGDEAQMSAAYDELELALIRLKKTLAAMDTAETNDGELNRIPYNNPDAIVRLDAGAFARPMVADENGDGYLDLVVVGYADEYKGLYAFYGDADSKDNLTLSKGYRLTENVDRQTYPTYNYDENGNYVSTLPFVGSVAYPDFDNSYMNGEGIDYGKGLTWPKQPVDGVSESYYSLADYDGDGARDLIFGASDWSEYGWAGKFDDNGVWGDDNRDGVGDDDGDGDDDPAHGWVMWAKNTGTEEEPVFANPSLVCINNNPETPVDNYATPSPSFFDWDKDGDLDLMCGSRLDDITYYQNIGTATEPCYAEGAAPKTEDGDIFQTEFYIFQTNCFDFNQDGYMDVIFGEEDGSIAFAENTGEFDATGTPIFKKVQYFMQQADHLKNGNISAPFSIDWDGDGDEDLFSGDSAGFISLIENITIDGDTTVNGDKVSELTDEELTAQLVDPSWAPPVRITQEDGTVIRFLAGYNGSPQGPIEEKLGYSVFTMADWDGDGDLDIISNNSWGKIKFIENLNNLGEYDTGKFSAPQIVEVEDETPDKPAWNWWDPEPYELVTQWRTTPFVVDLNKDGRPDIVMLDYEGYLAFFERLENGRVTPGQRIFSYKTSGSLWRINDTDNDDSNIGTCGRRKFTMTDWDGDGDLDVLLNTANAMFYENIGDVNDPWVYYARADVHSRNIDGHETAPTTCDWNRDGVPDLIISGGEPHFHYVVNKTPQFVPAVEIGDYDSAAQSVNVTTAEGGSFTVIFADYEDGVLEKVDVVPFDFAAGTNAVPHDSGINLSGGDKIMIWNDMVGAVPACAPKTISNDI